MLRHRHVHANSDLGWITSVFNLGTLTTDAAREITLCACESYEVKEFQLSCTGYSGFDSVVGKLTVAKEAKDCDTIATIESVTKISDLVGSVTLTGVGRKRLAFDPPQKFGSYPPSVFSQIAMFGRHTQWVKVIVDVTGTGTVSGVRAAVTWRAERDMGL